MQTLAFGMARCRASDRPRTLLARARMIWMWPGIALTRDHGHAIVPIGGENLRFWITRLHGPDALYTSFERAISQAAACVSKGDDGGRSVCSTESA